MLVQAVLENGVTIESLPGPTAFIPALVASGIKPEQFLFLGFPPRKHNELARFLRSVAALQYTLVFYESPRRIAQFLLTAAEVLGHRQFAVAKELSKKNEKIIRGNLEDLEGILSRETILGELVVVIEGRSKDDASFDQSPPRLETMDDLFTYFKETHNISKNQLKKVLMRKHS